MRIADFEPNSSGLAGTYSIYVSSDLTGRLFGCIDPSGNPATLCTVSMEVAVDTDPIKCHTGWQPSIMEGTRLPQTHCGVDGGLDGHGMHLHATGATAGLDGGGLTNWGMNLGIDFRQNCTCPSQPDAAIGTCAAPTEAYGPCVFDATGWTGISFWALLGPESTGSTALLTVADPSTAGQVGGFYPYNELKCGDPGCIYDAGIVGPGAPQKCDPFGKAFSLVNHWQFYAIPFSEMRQKGFGLPEGTPDLAHFLGVKFSLGKGAWDVWIDDISLYGKKGP
ncbi:MAG: hypothetical protein M3O46_12870 [Myxococcota bacterium]|nr:hypothetical protein [Myxococcota bacterium]